MVMQPAGINHRPAEGAYMTFTIDTDSNITAHDNTPAAENGLIAFATETELTKATAAWPITRLVETWNSFAGTPGFGELKPVKKFQNRQKAIRRIWSAIQVLAKPANGASLGVATISAARDASVQARDALAAFAAPKAASKNATTTKAPRAKKAKPAAEQKTPREGSKMAKVISMIQRKGGSTLEQIMKETGWLAHTTRGFMSTLTAKTGVAFTSTRRESDKARVYEAVR
jgi:Protein of unknown function (DUF3489)